MPASTKRSAPRGRSADHGHADWSIRSCAGRLRACRRLRLRKRQHSTIRTGSSKRSVADYPNHWRGILLTSLTRAPLTLRVNTVATDRETYLARLSAAGVSAHFGTPGRVHSARFAKPRRYPSRICRRVGQRPGRGRDVGSKPARSEDGRTHSRRLRRTGRQSDAHARTRARPRPSSAGYRSRSVRADSGRVRSPELETRPSSSKATQLDWTGGMAIQFDACCLTPLAAEPGHCVDTRTSSYSSANRTSVNIRTRKPGCSESLAGRQAGRTSALLHLFDSVGRKRSSDRTIPR